MLVQSLLPGMSLQRVKEWRGFWKGCLPLTLVDGNESVGVCSDKESDLLETGKAFSWSVLVFAMPWLDD